MLKVVFLYWQSNQPIFSETVDVWVVKTFKLTESSLWNLIESKTNENTFWHKTSMLLFRLKCKFVEKGLRNNENIYSLITIFQPKMWSHAGIIYISPSPQSKSTNINFSVSPYNFVKKIQNITRPTTVSFTERNIELTCQSHLSEHIRNFLTPTTLGGWHNMWAVPYQNAWWTGGHIYQPLF